MKTALITGGAHRIGAQIVKTLHENDFHVLIHYNTSAKVAEKLANKLNQKHQNSATIKQANLEDVEAVKKLANDIESIDLLVNNASVFYPTPVEKVTQDSWNQILNTNLFAPFTLSQTLASKLAKNQGCIINIVDIHSQRPLKNHAVYNISKAGISMMTKTLAKEFAPDVRVCGVSPGSIFWPENEATLSEEQKSAMLKKIVLKRQGEAQDIADTVVFLANATYITGQIINVDGGRTLNQ